MVTIYGIYWLNRALLPRNPDAAMQMITCELSIHLEVESNCNCNDDCT